MIMAVVTFMVFSIVFAVLVDKFEHILEVINTKITFDRIDFTSDINPIFVDDAIVEKCIDWCYSLPGSYEAKEKWIRRHIIDSWDQFWGGSLACFLLEAYVVGASIYVYNNLEYYIKK